MKGKKDIRKGSAAEIKKGLILLSAVIFFFLITFHADFTFADPVPCDCTVCHGNMHDSCTDWGSNVCYACHGYPPVSNTPGQNGLVVFPALTGSSSAGAHAMHATPSPAGMNYTCDVCHYEGMPVTPISGNYKIQIGFNIPGVSSSGASYDGQTLNPLFSYEGTYGTTVTTNGTQTCSNIYCHGATLTGGSNTSPVWTGAAPCGTCHGTTAGSAPTAGSHTKHAGNASGNYGFACATCHPNVTDGSHVNFSVQWNMSSGTYKGAQSGSTGTPAPSSSYGSCSNIYCHSSATGGTANTNAAAVPPLTDPRPLAAKTSPAWGGSYPMVCSNWTGQSCSISTSCHLGGYIIDPTQTYNNQYRSCYYCHGSNPPTGFTKPSYPSSPHRCYGCHNYPPTYAQDQPKSNSHWMHSYWAACNACHFATTSDGMTIKDPSKHANGVYDVVPDPSALYFNTTPVNFSYTPDIGGGTCTNISCHQARGIGTTEHWGGVWLNINRAWVSGSACYQVSFYNVSASGGTAPYTYFWDFGDGTTSTEQNPTHIYPSGGTRNGTLYVRDANNHLGASAVWPTANPVNTAPVANFAVSVYGWTVTLTDLSYDTDYNSCGHSGPGNIKIMWGDVYAGSPTTTEAINLTDQPSGKIYTHTYSKQGNLPNAQIYDVITDNANVQTQKYLGVAIPTTYTVSGRVANASGVGLQYALVSLRTMSGGPPGGVYYDAWTDANGYYSISGGAADGECYIVRQPVKSGYTFTPGDQTVCAASANVNWTSSP